MGKGIKIFKVLGIQISIDYTWFIVFVLFAWSLSYGYFPFRNPGFSTAAYLATGILSAVLLFTCVLIHELSHSYIANRLGMDIHEITLFIFGGVAQLTKEPEDAATELKIAIAGPVASLILAGLFYGAAAISPEAYPLFKSVLGYLGLINLVLVAFNMIPGFPLDGGRVFRALWWMKTGDINMATKVASNIGKGFAIFLIAMGLIQIFAGNLVGGLWSVFIGIFVQQAAESGYQQVLIKKALSGLKVKDLMSKPVITVDASMSLNDAVENFFFKFHHASFPVMSEGRIQGLLTLNSVRAVDKEKWNETRVSEVMLRLGPNDTMGPEDSAIDALSKMMSGGGNLGRFPVVRGDEVVGMVSRRDMMQMLEFKSGLGR
jgi:Zn-dependent protease